MKDSTTNRFKKRQERRAAKRKAPAIDITFSDDSLRSLLGLILHRLWLYNGALPAYQAASLIERGQPLYTERQGFTQYYR